MVTARRFGRASEPLLVPNTGNNGALKIGMATTARKRGHVTLEVMENPNSDVKAEKRASLPEPRLASSGGLGFHAGPYPGEPADATFATVAGTRVHYVDLGAGPPVVLLHGFASSLEVWSDLLPRLAWKHRTVALDLRGFGWSDHSQGDYSPRGQAELVWALLDHLGIDQSAVVGHSWGASVALAMALSAPERTTRIALYDGWIYEEQLSWLFRWARADWVGEYLLGFCDESCIRSQLAFAFHDSRYVTPERVKRTASRMALPGARTAALAAMRAMDFAEQQARYSTLRMPALVLWGQQDAIAAPAFGQRLAADLGAELIMFPRCGHFPMIEAAESSNATVDQFLDTLKRSWWNPFRRVGRRTAVLHRRIREVRNHSRRSARSS